MLMLRSTMRWRTVVTAPKRRLVALFTAGLTTVASPVWAATHYLTLINDDAVSTPLDCPIADHHSLIQLTQAGWSVASVQTVTVDYRIDAASQAPQSETSWMVVVQKENK